MVSYSWDHIHLKTADAEEMACWFETMFGVEVQRDTKNGMPRFRLKLGGASIFITDAEGHNPAPQIPYRGLEHFGVIVSDMDAAVEALKAKGCIFTAAPKSSRPGMCTCHVQGPEGVSVELLDRNYTGMVASKGDSD